MMIEPLPRSLGVSGSGWFAASSVSLLAVATMLIFTNDGYASSVEGQLPTGIVIVELACGILLIISSLMVARQRPPVSVGLAVVTASILLPLWAAWPALPTGIRAGVLATAPLGVAGATQVALTWHGDGARSRHLRRVYLLVGAGCLIHVAAYNPFFDPGCHMVCVNVRPFATGIISTRSALTAVSVIVVAATLVAGLAIRRARSSPAPKLISAGVIAALSIFAAAWATQMANWIEGQRSELLLLPFVAGASTSGAVVVATLRTWRTRLSIEQLILHLDDSEAGSKDLDGTVHEVQFALSEDEGWVDGMGCRITRSGAEDRQVVVSDRAGPVVRLLLAPGKQAYDVLEVLTPATRLALKNAQLAANTRMRLIEVQASQRRVVATSDAERRRIERDLHDGAQQRLVSAAFQMRLLRSRLPGMPQRLNRAEELVGDALRDLRRLAHGVFPSVLGSEGLWVALDELVKDADIAATLEVHGDDRISTDTAMAAYATAVAALEHASQQGGSEPARVWAGHNGDTLVISVEMQSSGDFLTSPEFVDVGDRVGAVGGELSVDSSGGLTALKAVLPCGS